MSTQSLTQAELKEYFHYNPDTGIFTRIKKTSKHSNNYGAVVSRVSDNGYVVVKIYGFRYSCHRLAFLYMTGSMPRAVDHINHNRADNRWCNIVEAEWKDNAKNRSLNKNNATGISGVRWCNTKQKWVADFSFNGKSVHLGYKDDFFEACCIRIAANNKHGYHENHGR